jgi:hypothetical protein
MTAQVSNKSNIANNLWVQMGALAVVGVVLIVLAAIYIW